MLDGAETTETGMKHREMLRAGIYTKSMLNSANRCEIAFGLSQGLVTGQPEFELPGYALELGVMMGDLMQLWSLRMLSGLAVPHDEARQLLSDRWDRRMPLVRDTPLPTMKDEKIEALLDLYVQWEDDVYPALVTQVGPLVGAEVPFRGTLGGIPIAGTGDLLFSRAYRDQKTCGQKSWKYRKPGQFNYELAHYSALTGLPDVGFLPFVHDLRKPRIDTDASSVTVGPAQLTWAAEVLERFASHMANAIKDPGVLQPATSGIGNYPCHPKWCGYFGRQCPVTRHLKREDFE